MSAIEFDEDLEAALEESDCHPDFVSYARRAAERGGTPILNSIRTFHKVSSVDRITEVGTQIERTLWEEGAQATLDKHGHVDETNQEILTEIVRGVA